VKLAPSVATVVLVLAAGCTSTEQRTQVAQPNCGLTAIPKDAHRIPSHGVDFLVFPAALGANYTGCKTMWLDNGHRLAVWYFERGELVWLKAEEPKGSDRSSYCRYNDGKLITGDSYGRHCKPLAADMM